MILFAALGWSIITVAMPFVVQELSVKYGFMVVLLIRLAHGAFQGRNNI